jgi:hypothetical protein
MSAIGVRPMEWKDVAEVGGATAGFTGFAWLVFRFFVGAAMANAVRDISALMGEMDSVKASVGELKHTVERREDKLDQLIMALANK